MFTYTKYMVEKNGLPVEFITDDLYHSGWVDDILGIRTYYEQQWLDRGLTIKVHQILASAVRGITGARCGNRIG